jgi:hypothetical protein
MRKYSRPNAFLKSIDRRLATLVTIILSTMVLMWLLFFRGEDLNREILVFRTLIAPLLILAVLFPGLMSITRKGYTHYLSNEKKNLLRIQEKDTEMIVKITRTAYENIVSGGDIKEGFLNLCLSLDLGNYFEMHSSAVRAIFLKENNEFLSVFFQEISKSLVNYNDEKVFKTERDIKVLTEVMNRSGAELTKYVCELSESRHNRKEEIDWITKKLEELTNPK